jgi:hypothetical protein
MPSQADALPADLPSESADPAPKSGARIVLVVLSVAVFFVSVFGAGVAGLIPLGVLVALMASPDGGPHPRVIAATRRNFALASAMFAATLYFWLAYPELSERSLTVLGGIALVLPLAMQERSGREGTVYRVVLTRRSLIFATWGLLIFFALYRTDLVLGFLAISVVLPFVLAGARARAFRHKGVEMGLIHHPARTELRPHLWQAVNIALCCVLLGALMAAGAGQNVLRIFLSTSAAGARTLLALCFAGLVLMAALALTPGLRVRLATNFAVAILSAFLVLQLVVVSMPPRNPVVLESPLSGEWYVFNAGRISLVNGHSGNEGDGIDFIKLGANGRSHTGGRSSPLTAYPGFGLPVLAPAGGRVVVVEDGFADNQPGTNGDLANHVVVDIGGGRYVVMAHIKQDSALVGKGDLVKSGQEVASVGNNGHSSQPHLHMHVQDHVPEAGPWEGPTLPVVFRNVVINRGDVWPRADQRELRSGDLISRLPI